MFKTITLASVAILAFAASAETAAAQGRGNGGERAEQAERGPGDRGRGRGGGDDQRGQGRGQQGDRGRSDAGVVQRAVREAQQVERRGQQEVRRERREADRRLEDRRREVERVERRGRDEVRRDWREADRRVEDRRREIERRGDDTRVVFFTRDRDQGRGLIQGCPPGLAWRNNGCLPPGQARRLEREWREDWRRYDAWWGRPREAERLYRYDNGYLYQLTRQGSLVGYVPVLGGALWTGQPWPERYAYEPAPRYLTSYYRLNEPYDWRYADGVVYGVDPQTQAIQQVVALVTGQPWTVGQRMPSGYDVYNLPYGYRSQYVDSPDRWYRYSDGYVYQVDPTTRLVQAVIQLLT